MTDKLDKAIYDAYRALMDNLSYESFEALPDYVRRAVEAAEQAEIDYIDSLKHLINSF